MPQSYFDLVVPNTGLNIESTTGRMDHALIIFAVFLKIDCGHLISVFQHYLDDDCIVQAYSKRLFKRS